ncbi:unnamed protein product [Rotaria socialis]
MATLYCIKVTQLPKGINSEKLAAMFMMPQHNITIPNNQEGPNYYAWVNGFLNESSATQFVEKWNHFKIGSGKITCKMVNKNSKVQCSRHPSMPRASGNGADPSNRENQTFISSTDSKRHRSLDPTSIMSSMISDTRDDSDTDEKPQFASHSSRITRYNVTDSPSNMHNNPGASSATSQSFIDVIISKSRDTYNRSRSRVRDASWSSREPVCRNGIDCSDPSCNCNHPAEWQICDNDVGCEEFECKATDPEGRKTTCFNGNDCKDFTCELLHPLTRMNQCVDGDQCSVWDCKALHPYGRPKACFFGKYCYNSACLCLHPLERQLCPNGSECIEFICQFDHPSSRVMRCDRGVACNNFYCDRLHPVDWDLCEQGIECKNPTCSHAIHPADWRFYLQQNTTSEKNQKQSYPRLKSIEQRNIEREQTQLPILAAKDEFCRRLKAERLLVVRAATGSGKSTQLPQYAAEYFGGLVVCTQPRVVAAVSLARRVANEYDGISVGKSVGYRVGRTSIGKNQSQVPGTDIIFMTDSALIHESQEDRQLSNIKVLIIDEAHERSLNTDIVIGLAKILLSARTTDFYVVIASATIDPSKFLDYFKRSPDQVLDVPGRVYDISVDSLPKPDDLTEGEHAVSALLQSYDKYQGHSLVFLPGQREIERALERFSLVIPDNCVALPLYGSLSPEEQDRVLQFDEGLDGERRMVVFCTNVAETSLTIKNTRLVIDSGLAKEARFDTKRRLTVIETVRISRSSADQRKGRAGRTAPGHCIRLYRDDELVRPNIQPEILRSSLDMAVLQLVRLQFKPKNFPFMDLPSCGTEALEKSLTLLKDLACIDKDDRITLRGELFADLGLDPRLSAFLVDTYIEHDPILNATAVIVAILTAPGSLFFMGGATKEAKEAAKGRIALGAQEYQSDLLYLVSVYEKWKTVGIVDSNTHLCVKCQKLIKRSNSCRSCRAVYSVENTLNNKVLTVIESASDTSISIIKNKRWQLNPGNLIDADQTNIIGTHLFKNFPEQYGHLLVSHLPNEGVCMVVNDFRARITATSVFVQRHLESVHFVAMSITQLPTGAHIIELLHPVTPPKTADMKVITNLFTVNHVGWEWNTEIRKEMNTLKTESWKTWLILEYDSRLCKLIIWSEESMKDSIKSILTPIVQNALHFLLSRTRSIDCGPIQASFESGLHCLQTENKYASSNNIKNRLDLHCVPCKNFDELYEWFSHKLCVHRKDIRENNFQPCKEPMKNEESYKSPPFFVIFNSDEVFKRALSHLPSINAYTERKDASNTVNINEKDAWGRQLLLRTKENVFVSAEQMKNLLPGKIVNCKQIGRNILPGLQLTNMPVHIDQTKIQKALGNDLVPARINMLYSDKTNPNIGSSSARIYFETKEQYVQAISRLRKSSLLKSHTITIRSKRTQACVNINADPTMQAVKMEPQTFLITATSRRVALDIYSKSSQNWTINSSASVTVTYVELYPNFEELLQSICTRFHTKVEKIALPTKSNYSKAIRCIFTDASPTTTALAASILSQETSPIIIKLMDDRQKCLFKELFDENLIQKWASELKLLCEKKDKYGAVIEIRGPQVEQGQFMRRIADYSDDFNDRYRLLDLNAAIIGFFGRQKAADTQLQEINSVWVPKGCSVTLDRRTSCIILYAQLKVTKEMLNACESEVKLLLEKLAVNDRDDGQQKDFARECAFCRRLMVATRTFRICGHAYCRCAVNMLHEIPLKCLTCNYTIHIQDVQEMFSNNRADFIQLCKKSIQNYLLTSTNPTDNDQLFCPNNDCKGLIIRSHGYQTCLTCGQGVCGLCRLIDDELHEGRNCAERNEAHEKLGEFLPQLFKAAEEFTTNNWPVDLPPIVRFDKNPYLLGKGCESFSRFYKGVELIGSRPPLDLGRGFFAFHGTSIDAIESICKAGFDPSRRRGQAYGIGEYFGVTAAISHGYSQKSEPSVSNLRMIIAFILQTDRVHMRPGFCYVVNNPIDWSAAFNLPVAVLTYGKNSSEDHASPFPDVTPTPIDQLPTKSTWQSPFRWFWWQKGETFEPYNDVINSMLEQYYENWKRGKGPSSVTTPPLIRYIDDMPQTYDIDFVKNTQKNTQTGFRRRLERRHLEQSQIETSRNWFFRNQHHVWTAYESMIQQTIETAFQAYWSGIGESSVIIRFPGRPEEYELDFVTGRQTNKSSGEVRIIERK